MIYSDNGGNYLISIINIISIIIMNIIIIEFNYLSDYLYSTSNRDLKGRETQFIMILFCSYYTLTSRL